VALYVVDIMEGFSMTISEACNQRIAELGRCSVHGWLSLDIKTASWYTASRLDAQRMSTGYTMLYALPAKHEHLDHPIPDEAVWTGIPADYRKLQ